MCLSAPLRGNHNNLSSFFTSQSTSPRSHYRSAISSFLNTKSKPSSKASNSAKIDVDRAKPFSNGAIRSDSLSPISSFSRLFGSLVKNKQFPDAICCYKRFASSGCAPNFFTLNMLLDCYCNMKLASGCGFSSFGIILKSGYSPNTVTFTSLVKGLCLEEKIGEASELFRKIIQFGCHPSVVTCTTLINGLCKTGNLTVALELHRQMVSGEIGVGGGCKPTLVSYGALIDGLCKAGFLLKGRELVLEMKGFGIPPNVFVYTSLLDGFFRSGKWEEAESLYKEMVDTGVRPNAKTFCVLKVNIRKQGKSEKVNEFIELMVRNGDLPHSVLCHDVWR